MDTADTITRGPIPLCHCVVSYVSIDFWKTFGLLRVGCRPTRNVTCVCFSQLSSLLYCFEVHSLMFVLSSYCHQGPIFTATVGIPIHYCFAVRLRSCRHVLFWSQSLTKLNPIIFVYALYNSNTIDGVYHYAVGQIVV